MLRRHRTSPRYWRLTYRRQPWTVPCHRAGSHAHRAKYHPLAGRARPRQVEAPGRHLHLSSVGGAVGEELVLWRAATPTTRSSSQLLVPRRPIRQGPAPALGLPHPGAVGPRCAGGRQFPPRDKFGRPPAGALRGRWPCAQEVAVALAGHIGQELVAVTGHVLHSTSSGLAAGTWCPIGVVAFRPWGGAAFRGATKSTALGSSAIPGRNETMRVPRSSTYKTRSASLSCASR